MGVFLLDVFCLGAKNAFLTIFSTEFKYQNGIERIASSQALQSVEPSRARKLVEDTVEYARDLGFEPQREYRDAALVLGDIDAGACREEFAFGKDGQPLYVRGPNDSDRMVDRTLTTLQNRCGEDGFHYIVGMGDFSPDEF